MRRIPARVWRFEPSPENIQKMITKNKKDILDFQDRKKYDLVSESRNGEILEKIYRGHHAINTKGGMYPTYLVSYNCIKKYNSLNELRQTVIIKQIN